MEFRFWYVFIGFIIELSLFLGFSYYIVKKDLNLYEPQNEKTKTIYLCVSMRDCLLICDL